jgi:hypothetical protein
MKSPRLLLSAAALLLLTTGAKSFRPSQIPPLESLRNWGLQI